MKTMMKIISPLQEILESRSLRVILKSETDSTITKVFIGLKEWSDDEVVTMGISQYSPSRDGADAIILDLLLWTAEMKLKDA